MDRTKIPFTSRLKPPSTTPTTTLATSRPPPRMRAQEEPAPPPPARRMLSRRSKSFADLRPPQKPTEPFLRRGPTPSSSALRPGASKPLLKATSTSDLRIVDSSKRLLTRPGLKTIQETGSKGVVTKATTVKRVAGVGGDEAPKPKVARPAKPAPYDYKARFNLLQEKHTDLLQKSKAAQEKLVAAEETLEVYDKLVQAHDKLQEDYDTVMRAKFELELGNDRLLKERDGLQIELRQTKESVCQIQDDYTKLKDVHSTSIINMNKLQDALNDLQSKFDSLVKDHSNLKKTHSLLQGQFEKLKRSHDDLLHQNIQLDDNLSEAQATIKQLEEELHEYKTSLQSHEELRRTMHNQIQDLKGTIRVFCRVRPLKPLEDHKPLCNINCIDDATLEIRKSKESINVISGRSADLKLEFVFDKVFPPEATQAEVFEDLSQLVQSALDGYHICVFAYGQTGSGKTYTMQGQSEGRRLGMIPRTVDLIFRLIGNLRKVGWEYVVEASFLEIYNEVVRDLLDPNNKEHLDIRFNEGKGITVTNLTTKRVESTSDLQKLMDSANRNRASAATNFNEHSSRSHAVTKIILTGVNKEMNISYVGSVSLVDLAGSESAKTSERMTETKNINKSLSALGTVMSALHNKEGHIPYRNSKLTYLLQSCLGGNSKTLMFVNIAPFEECFGESVNALRFAAKVKEVKIGAKKNKTYLNSASTVTGNTS